MYLKMSEAEQNAWKNIIVGSGGRITSEKPFGGRFGYFNFQLNGYARMRFRENSVSLVRRGRSFRKISSIMRVMKGI